MTNTLLFIIILKSIMLKFLGTSPLVLFSVKNLSYTPQAFQSTNRGSRYGKKSNSRRINDSFPIVEKPNEKNADLKHLGDKKDLMADIQESRKVNDEENKAQHKLKSDMHLTKLDYIKGAKKQELLAEENNEQPKKQMGLPKKSSGRTQIQNQQIKTNQKKKQDKYSWIYWYDWKFFLSSLISLSGLFLTYKAYQSVVQQSFRRQMLRMYSTIKLQNYIDSPIYDEMKKILEMSVVDQQIKMVAGCPGIGKTTTIKKLLLEMKEKGDEVYYFSFGDYTDRQLEKEEKRKLYGLLTAIKNKFQSNPKYEGKKVKVVLDDLNRLQKKTTFIQIMQDLYRKVSCKEIDLICISSNSGFIERQVKGKDWRSLRSKFGQVLIIQDCKNAEMLKQFHINIVYQKSDGKIKKCIKDNKQFDNPIAVAIANMRLTTRVAIQLTRIITKTSFFHNQKKSLEYLQILEKQKIEQLKNQINQIIDKKNNKSLMKSLIKQILKVSQQLTMRACQNIKTNLNGKSIINETLRQFDDQNLLIFCRPRTHLQREAFRLSSVS